MSPASDNLPLSDSRTRQKAPPLSPCGRQLSVADYIRAATAENTRRAHESDLRQFLAWGGTIPASPEMVATYLAERAGALAVATLERHLASISRAHASRGLESPTRSDLVKACMRGIRRVHGSAQRQVAPILIEDLKAMVTPLGADLRGLRDRALLLVGFAGAFRRSELVAINCTDLEWVAEGLIVTLPRSKTDQEGKGRLVAIPRGSPDLCPLEALGAWLRSAGIEEGTLFRAIDCHGSVYGDGLSPDSVARIIKKRAAAVGLDPARFSGHSLRAGLVTSAAAAGVPEWAIRRLTGHKSEAMLHRYVRPVPFNGAVVNGCGIDHDEHDRGVAVRTLGKISFKVSS
jgi:integrase